jgi:hypothetical protein
MQFLLLIKILLYLNSKGIQIHFSIYKKASVKGQTLIVGRPCARLRGPTLSRRKRFVRSDIIYLIIPR